MDRRKDGQKEKWTEGKMDRWMDGWKGGWKGGWTDKKSKETGDAYFSTFSMGMYVRKIFHKKLFDQLYLDCFINELKHQKSCFTTSF